MENKLIYNVEDKPAFGKMLVFAFQQVLAVLAATILVPVIIKLPVNIPSAILGAGLGTIVYLLFTKFKSPVVISSSFAFLGALGNALAFGYFGIALGALFAGLVYVAIAFIVRRFGTAWISKLMPPVIIGPTVAIIALTLSPNAIRNITLGNVLKDGVSVANPYICLFCGLVALFAAVISAIYGKKMIRLIPFIIGILVGYLIALVFTLIGNATNTPALQIINFEPFKNMKWVPDLTFLHAIEGFKEFKNSEEFWHYFSLITVSYVPVAFAVFAEHIADHKNISNLIVSDLLEDPGLSRTLMGDGVGSIVGATFGGCPNTTYCESVGCVAISRNASIITIFATAILCIILSFVAPFVTFLATIPSCVMGGVCIILYGFIAVSGLKMIQGVDLGDNRNLFVVSVILICGVGGLVVSFGKITITEVACALILGIVTNIICNIGRNKEDVNTSKKPEEESFDKDDNDLYY